MAYDAAKAHEYYIKYRKKGLKKGRKKGTKAKQTNLVGLSTGGLNDDGKMQWALQKEKLKSDMNAALSKAKTPEEKEKIRSEYQNKALQALKEMKGNASLAKAKATKASTKSTGKTTKSSSGTKGSSGSSSGSKSSSSSKSSGSDTATKQMITQLQNTISELSKKISSMSAEQKAQTKATLQEQADIIKKKLANKNSAHIKLS